MIYLYRLLYTAARFVALVLKPFFGKNLRDWFDLRSRSLEKSRPFSDAYWFHAASGEIEYCKSVIRLLKETRPEARVVVTYTSPSAEKLFHNVRSYVDQFIPLPWDRPAPLNELLDYLRPRMLVFSRTDLWPELMEQVRLRGIPMGVISYSPGSVGPMQRWLLPKLDFISCLNPELKTVLENLNPRVSVDGDTRFDQVFHRLEGASRLNLKTQAKILACGSTWPEDEEVLFQILKSLVGFHGYKVVLSPHEVAPDNILRLRAELTQLGCSSALFSEEKNPENIQLTKDVLIIDRIGFLADVYRFAGAAFVGGSFREKVHSVMEPLCCGIPVLTGPFYRNNPEAVRYQGHFVFACETPGDIEAKLKSLGAAPLTGIAEEMRKNRDASLRVLKIIEGIPPRT